MIRALARVASAVARRLAWGVFVVVAVGTLVFLVQHTLPSDPARMVAGPQARAQDVARLRTAFGFDRPLHVQYARFVRRLVHRSKEGDHSTCSEIVLGVHVDLGRSTQHDRAVLTVLAERLPRTALLAAAALFVQTSFGTMLGALAARRRGSAWDAGTVGVALVLGSAPTFVTGLLLQWLFAHQLRLLPLDGFGVSATEHLVSVVLPALTLGTAGAAMVTRLVRDEVAAALTTDHARTARAKGVSPAGVLWKHALRNALVPLATVAGLDLGALMGGAVATEQLFRWPGLGALGVGAILNRDAPMMMGVAFATSSAVVLASAVVDAVVVLLDPRLRR